MNTAVTSETVDIEVAAAALRQSESSRIGIDPLTDRYPGLTLEGAYAIQRLNLEQRLSRGERLVGRKIGLTSLAIQQQLGVDSPDYGAITDAMQVASGGEFDPALLIAPRIEAEFAFEIGSDLPASPSYDELVAAVHGVAVAMELIDSRIADWRITLLDTVADNASMARVVWGDFVPATPALLAELPDSVITLLRDDDEACGGPGSAVLGDPLVSLHWLANALGAQGDRFRAGDRVLAGAVAAAVDFTPGARWTVHAEGLPAATLTSATASPAQA
ncbi:MAG: 2-keto-4-pentenoate hydratase [Microbacterium sp.]